MVSALADDCIANLSDQDDESRWSVVMLGIGPNKENGVHYWDEELRDLWHLFHLVGELVEKFNQGFEVLVVLIGFSFGGLDFLLKLAEWASVSRFVLLHELKHLLDLV